MKFIKTDKLFHYSKDYILFKVEHKCKEELNTNATVCCKSYGKSEVNIKSRIKVKLKAHKYKINTEYNI